ncbi:hypothetical protein K443DRAFT_677956 [Laccaria amethystina LaAM-08-1]|uniref:Uncharacterized protein n=1 Tax=Laccaria amethystina LaAM-08-1 TaxID=1095629 RepID=A0A0C9WSU3_9AGAR|nr:hypothetical protein K443DRAFT_677956 [Laccaria amethystina LaAM-08-1]
MKLPQALLSLTVSLLLAGNTVARHCNDYKSCPVGYRCCGPLIFNPETGQSHGTCFEGETGICPL